MSSPETVKPANTLQALNSGSGLDKLGAPVDAQYVSSDNEGAHTDTHDTDLNDLLQIAHCEEVERMAMLDRCVGYDDASFGAADLTREDTFATNDGSDVNNGSTHGMDFARQTLPGFDAPESTTQTPDIIRADTYQTGFVSFEFVGEDDGDDLLCDFAPSAMQSDGEVGLVGTDGVVRLPVSPGSRGLTKRSSNQNDDTSNKNLVRTHSLSAEDSNTAVLQPPRGEVCLSDSWQTLDFETARDRDGGSLARLREKYQQSFGKETSSNNRQWLVRRLATIEGRYGDDARDPDDPDELCDDDAGSGDVYSEMYSGSDDAGDSSPFTDISAGTHTDFFGTGGTDSRVRRHSMSKSDSVAGGRGANASHAHAARRKNRKGSFESRTDGLSGNKKRKGGSFSDSDDQQEGEESPVKSRNTSGAGGGVHRGRASGGKATARGRDLVGANGRRSKHHNPWALEEAEALVDGVQRCGGGKWADIKKLGFPAIEHRTAVDLKDKWRNLLRIAMLPHQPAKSAGDKKREIPSGLLQRVRDLAAKQAKKAAADGRRPCVGR